MFCRRLNPQLCVGDRLVALVRLYGSYVCPRPHRLLGNSILDEAIEVKLYKLEVV